MKTFLKTALFLGALATGFTATAAHAEEHGGGHEAPAAEHAAAGGEHHAAHVEFFKWDMNAPPVGWLAVDFALFLALLVWFGGKPLSNTILARHHAVKKAIEEAAAAKAEALKKAAEYEDRIKQLDGEIASLRLEFKKGGEATRERLNEAGKRTAERIAKDTSLTISAEESRARDALQQEAARLALGMAEKMVKERLAAADHKKLRDDFVRELRS
jgi:F-type H+-transporting ATPase subunit b